MRVHYPAVSLAELCRLFGKTRQAYYENTWHKEDRLLEQDIVLQFVKAIRRDMPRIGTRKLLHLLEAPLKAHQIKMGRDRLFDLLYAYGLLIRRKRRIPATTNSYHWFRKYHNLIKELAVTGPEQLWVSDITYIAILGGFSYLSLITDAYSHKIVGYRLFRTLDSEGSLQALRMAISNRKQPDQVLIHHSDRGIQYCCKDYVEKLKSNNILISMTEKGDPYENAMAERVNGILKTEFGLDSIFTSHELAEAKVNEVILIYNSKRPHASCDYLTPDQAHERTGYLEKRWKTYLPKRKTYEVEAN